MSRAAINPWTVDYGHGPESITVPHAWNQDASVRWEGPAIYRTRISVPREPSCLLFHGISYQARVHLNGKLAAEHRGIWDAFEVALTAFQGQEVEVCVEVVKNGGETFPVRDVASGFLPYVFNTFGGIHGEVEIVSGEGAIDTSPPLHRKVSVEGHKIFVDGHPIYPRGLLTWGWYPDLGHTNPTDSHIRKELEACKIRGFNLIKFCLWVPPHRYLELLEEYDMWGWMELPLWDPSSDTDKLDAIAQEFERIVLQYRHHERILAWTVGCELSGATPPEYRQRLVDRLIELTGSPLVKDNSGGAEMYGGDSREFGTFYDFHPYCDTEFYPLVLDSLLPGPRERLPILLGEFNDIDTHWRFQRILSERPFWSSDDPDLNDQGVRWQFDLSQFLKESRFATEWDAEKDAAFLKRSLSKSEFIRKYVQEAVRAREDISGYVITKIRDTPISTSGFFDQWGDPKGLTTEPWNHGDCLFLIPSRRPPWVNGGNRPGFIDPCNHFSGSVFWKVGVHSESGVRSSLSWEIKRGSERILSGTAPATEVASLESREVGQIYWPEAGEGEYELTVRFGEAFNSWPIWVVTPLEKELPGWTACDPAGLFSELTLGGGPNLLATRLPQDLDRRLDSGNVLLFLVDEGTLPMPFWRESAFEFPGLENFDSEWARLLPVGSDRAIDLQAFAAYGEPEVLMNRVDARTYKETPYILRTRTNGGTLVATTLRPFGGLGVEPTSLAKNPAGVQLLRDLMKITQT